MELRSFLVVLCSFMYLNSVSPDIGGGGATTLLNETDHLALMAFKVAITEDPFRVLHSWNDSLHFCHWFGISCSHRHKHRVVRISLNNKELRGILSPHIGNLSFLKTLGLSNNSFTGNMPHDIARLFRLQVLDLSNNTFDGEIPANLSHCSNIQYLILAGNNLQGRIPVELSLLGKIKVLEMGFNNLSGSIPNSLGNLSSLTAFDLQNNNLVGIIPQDLARLRKLRYFGVGDNNLSGMIPVQLYNISSISLFSVSRNHQLQGSLPRDINLPNLEWFGIGFNRFTGTVPMSLLNCSKLAYLELALNMFEGPMPRDLGRLQNLWKLHGSDNNFGTGGSEENDLQFLYSLTNCTNLQLLEMASNALTGSLPISIVNLSSRLEVINLQKNHIHGGIPLAIQSLASLTFLNLGYNNIGGGIPDNLGELQGLQVLFLIFNELTGSIPSSLGNLTQLSILSLYGNKLDGSIPSSLGNCQNLVALDLSYNNITGVIPTQIFDLESLSRGLGLAHNYLTGPLPFQVGKLKNLEVLYVSDNKLSGGIPATLGECVHLSILQMQGNKFSGNIPESLGGLRGIELLDISRNNLTGMIPHFLRDLPFLTLLNLSFNDLEGAVPQEGIFKNSSAFRVDGNHKLCGGISKLRLPLCPRLASKNRKKSLLIKVIASSIVVSLCLLLLAFSVIMLLRRRVGIDIRSESLLNFKHLRISYPEIVKATNSFSEANLLGIGTYSSVYRGILDRGEMNVAVKVLNLQERGGSESFMSECKVLRNVRHRNLIKILTSCSSVDSQGNDFKALVFEYIPNGNLTKWLYPKADQQYELGSFGFAERLNIGIDVASALDYLHHHTQSAIVHCDLKPSNILLDSTMTARVGDFGLAKILSSNSDNSGQNLTTSLDVRGSIGYVAPEYGIGGEISTQGDVYSFGILLLEMMTGKSPTDNLFRDGLTLGSFAKMSLPGRVLEVTDPRLLKDVTPDWMQECLVAILKVGIACSTELAEDRMPMGDVVIELNSIREIYRSYASPDED